MWSYEFLFENIFHLFLKMNFFFHHHCRFRRRLSNFFLLQNFYPVFFSASKKLHPICFRDDEGKIAWLINVMHEAYITLHRFLFSFFSHFPPPVFNYSSSHWLSLKSNLLKFSSLMFNFAIYINTHYVQFSLFLSLSRFRETIMWFIVRC